MNNIRIARELRRIANTLVAAYRKSYTIRPGPGVVPKASRNYYREIKQAVINNLFHGTPYPVNEEEVNLFAVLAKIVDKAGGEFVPFDKGNFMVRWYAGEDDIKAAEDAMSKFGKLDIEEGG